MGDLGKAVFLSYASQDAEAARRICETLRQAGVEVWFDTDGGLEHGDEWDAKIRRQIKECVLFLPIISANTQAREEGYFRLEWDLAAERARTIASGVAFILPVVIDDTKEPVALVPDRFRTVQWTRLPGGTVPADVLQRFLKLWSHRTGLLKHAETVGEALRPDGSEESGRKAPPTIKPSSRWLAPVIAGGVIAVLALILARPWETAPVPPVATKAAKPAAAPRLSEARQLVAKAWEQMNKAELARAELEVADDLCKRAAALDPVDADVWAAWSQVDSWYLYHNLDNSPARREGARTKAARALQLAPGSYEARLAQACQLVRGGGNLSVSRFAAEADGLLRALQQENPDEPRALLARAILLRNTGKADEAREHFRRLAKNPAFTAWALNELGWVEWINSDYRAAEIAADASIALQPYWGNLALKIWGAGQWRGDLDLAKATLDRIPVAVQQEDQGVVLAVQVYYLRREPQNMLGVLNSVPREWLQTNVFDGPKAYWAALAHQMAGQGEAAQVQWRKALNLVERRLADQPDSGSLLHWKGLLLAAAGDRAEGGTVLRLARDLGNKNSPIADATDQILLGNLDAALTLLEKAVAERSRGATAAMYRLNPMWDPLRDQPRFQALLARMEADPRFSPKAKAPAIDPKPETPDPGPASPPPADSKSVAVLAFANLSDEKANEYFSDGISEELISALGRVPGLTVKGSTSAFYFKHKEDQFTSAEIARQLGVTYLVRGSVRKAGDKVRITAQLTRAATDDLVWSSEPLDRKLEDAIAVQEEIAALIAQNLKLKLDVGSSTARKVNPEAHRLVLEGRYFWNQRSALALDRAEAAFRQAIVLAPGFAEAHAGLADVYQVRMTNFTNSGEDAPALAELKKAQQAAERARELDPSLAEPYATLGYVTLYSGSFSEAAALLQRSIALNPNLAVAHRYSAPVLGGQGRLDLGVEAARRAVEIDPLSVVNCTVYARFLGLARRYPEALEISARALRLQADELAITHWMRLVALWALGRREEAIEEARLVLRADAPGVGGTEALWVLHAAGLGNEVTKIRENLESKLAPENYLRGFNLVAVGRAEEAWPFLRRTPRSGMLSLLFYSPVFDSVRDDPRFQQLMTKLACAEEYKVGRETLARMLKEAEAKR